MQTHPATRSDIRSDIRSGTHSGTGVGRPGILAQGLARLTTGLALRKHRRALLTLDPHLLRDIGLSETEARREAERPFWDVPVHWRG